MFSASPGNVSHVRLRLLWRAGGGRAASRAEGGFERAWWQTFVYVFLLVHRFKGEHVRPIGGIHISRRLETHCGALYMVKMSNQQPSHAPERERERAICDALL